MASTRLAAQELVVMAVRIGKQATTTAPRRRLQDSAVAAFGPDTATTDRSEARLISAARLLRLQRSAGNQRVVRLVADARRVGTIQRLGPYEIDFGKPR